MNALRGIDFPKLPLGILNQTHILARVFNLNPYSILAGFVFSTIGLGAFSYGKKLDLWQPRLIGLVLMVYPYFVTNEWLLWGIGVGLLVALWFYHHE
jgi:hypothetical protein